MKKIPQIPTMAQKRAREQWAARQREKDKNEPK